jgi:hypothetical protein
MFSLDAPTAAALPELGPAGPAGLLVDASPGAGGQSL